MVAELLVAFIDRFYDQESRGSEKSGSKKSAGNCTLLQSVLPLN